MNLTYISSMAHSAYLQNFFKRLPPRLLLDALESQLDDPYFRNSEHRRAWHQNYPILNFLNATFRDTFNKDKPSTETPFVSGLIIGTAAIISIVETDSERGWPDNAHFLQKIPAHHFQDVANGLKGSVKSKAAEWKTKYPCFQAVLDYKLTYEQDSQATEIGKKRFHGIFAAIGWLIATAESEIPEKETEVLD